MSWCSFYFFFHNCAQNSSGGWYYPFLQLSVWFQSHGSIFHVLCIIHSSGNTVHIEPFISFSFVSSRIYDVYFLTSATGLISCHIIVLFLPAQLQRYYFLNTQLECLIQPILLTTSLGFPLLVTYIASFVVTAARILAFALAIQRLSRIMIEIVVTWFDLM